MDLRERLRRLSSLGPEEESLSPYRAECPKAVPGEEVSTPHGTVWLAAAEFPLIHDHGRRALGEIAGIEGERLFLLTGDAALQRFDACRTVFIDTETTSLAGGAGVFVFMAGAGFVVKERSVFRVEQYFMRDYDEEHPFLAAFNDRCAGFDGMVSFFGKNFDRYRLEDRMTAEGIDSRLPVKTHLDLYHAGRRLYRGRFPDLRLRTLEERLLGFFRRFDVPGSECPQAYFAYLRGEDRGRMAGVFEHNLWDILSLCGLAVEVDRCVRRPDEPRTCLALARLLAKAGKLREASDLLDRACAELGREESEALEARMLRLRVMRRLAAASSRLEAELLDLHAGWPDDPGVLLAMAKFYEHGPRDLDRALNYARRALLRLDEKSVPAREAQRRLFDTKHRIARLEKKACGRGL